MKLWKVIAIVFSIGVLEITEAPIRNAWEKIGPAGKEEKLARCVAVADIIDNEQLRVEWANGTNYAYGNAIDEHCSDPRECMHRRSYWLQKVRGNGEGGFVSRDNIRQWGESEFCQGVVKDYKFRQATGLDGTRRGVANPGNQVPPETKQSASSDSKGTLKSISERWVQSDGGRDGFLATCIKDATSKHDRNKTDAQVSDAAANARCEEEAKVVDVCLNSTDKNLQSCLNDQFTGD